MKVYSAVDRQKQIYFDGLRGKLIDTPSRYDALRRRAKGKLSSKAFAYIDGGAGQEQTMAANRQAIDRWQIVPRMMRDVGERSLQVSYLDRTYSSPFFLCPIGVLELAHREADMAVAKAAASLRIPMLFSNQASRPMEEVASVMQDAPRMFQLYWSKSDELVASFVTRAEQCQCDALVCDARYHTHTIKERKESFLKVTYSPP